MESYNNPSLVMSKAIILLSGGLDSTVALYWARQHHEVVGAVSFDYGSKHNDKEIMLAIWHCQQFGIPHNTVSLPFVNELFESNLLKSGGEIPDGHYSD
ncbi:MAG: 7-cyano-7-deazaguanine synthase, partial [Prosthecobacter sp.]|nr:7-cyano-7-deazaguanine synthase [Prosthecobacter sp.]